MKVWKSPILYLCILLVAAVTAAMAAPYVISWNSYRDDLEAYGKALTGREVTIAGPISARLFPWPSLTVEDVHVANLPALEQKDFASAARIELQVQLGGLFSGAIQVQSIDIAHPVISLERTTAGVSNWSFTPPQGKPSEMLGRVKLDQIRLRDGVVQFIDRRRATPLEINGLEATLAAPGLTGPWRLRGTGDWRGQKVDLSFNTGSLKADEPLRFSAHAAAADSSGFAYGFDGESSDGRITGQLRIEPATPADSKSDVEGRLRPMVFTAKADASFDDVALNDIAIAPQDTQDGGTLMTGNAHIKIGPHIDASLALEAPRIDLDAIAGAQSRRLLREGQGLVALNQALARLPAEFSLNASIKVTSLTADGEDLDNVAIDVNGGAQNLRISRAYAGLPGRSAVLLKDGVLLPGGAGAELTGRFSIESGDSRALANWLFPEAKAWIEKAWQGSRGRFKAQTDLSYKAGRVHFSAARYELDGIAGTGDLTLATGGEPSVDLRIDTDRLDLDNLLGPGRGTGALALFGDLLPSQAAGNLRLTVQAGTLLLNGVEAQDIAFDVASSRKGLELRTVQIGSVGGARLDADGLVLDSGSGNDGAIDFTLAADDPRGFLHLVGALPPQGEPGWLAALGKTEMKARLAIKPATDGSTSAIEIDGTSGDLTLAVSGDIVGDSLSRDALVQGTVQLASPTFAPLATLVGFVPAAVDQTPARVILTGKGSRAEGFIADLQVQALAENFEYNGTVAPDGALKGKATLRSTNATPLFAALGLPGAVLPSGNVLLDAVLAPAEGQGITATVTGKIAEQPVNATLTRDVAGRVTGNVDTGPLMLRDVLAASLLSWTGGSPQPASALAAALPLGLEGEVWIVPESLSIRDSFSTRNVQVVLTAAAGEIHLELYGKDAAGRDAKIRLVSKPAESEGSRVVEGKLSLPLSLPAQLKRDDGTSVADGEGVIDVNFTGTGRSPGGVMAALAGEGSLKVSGLMLRDINVTAFKDALGTAPDTAAVVAAFDALRRGGGLAFGDVQAAIVIKDGQAALTPLSMNTADAAGTLKVLADLALGHMDAALTLKMPQRVDWPAMEIAYTGSPGALTRSEDKTQLFGHLGVSVMDKGVAELERLRLEQEKLAAAEAQARVEDQEKLQDYYAQHDELRARQRELTVHAVVRQRAADALRASIESERGANADLNKAEMKQRLRELRFYRRLAKSGGVIDAMADQPAAKPKPKVVAPPSIIAAPQTIPDILVQPLPLPPSQDAQPQSPSQ